MGETPHPGLTPAFLPESQREPCQSRPGHLLRSACFQYWARLRSTYTAVEVQIQEHIHTEREGGTRKTQPEGTRKLVMDMQWGYGRGRQKWTHSIWGTSDILLREERRSQKEILSAGHSDSPVHTQEHIPTGLIKPAPSSRRAPDTDAHTYSDKSREKN